MLIDGVEINIKSDGWLMSLVYATASKSKDMRTKIGAVIVTGDKECISNGRNGLPRGADDNVFQRQLKPAKSLWFEHAERNAIFNAARLGRPTVGGTMYTQGMPCSDCARAIIQAGIITVVVHKVWNDENSENWSLDVTETLFKECGVRTRIWDGRVFYSTGWRRGVEFPLHNDEQTEKTG